MARRIPAVGGGPSVERVLARRLVASIRDRAPELLAIDAVDLGSALEQQLYFVLRDRVGASPGGAWTAAPAMTGVAVAGALRSLAARGPGPHPIVVLVREPVHLRLLSPIEAVLQERASEAVIRVRVGRAAGRRLGTGFGLAPRLFELLQPGLIRPLAALEGRILRRLHFATGGWDAAVGSDRAALARAVAGGALPRIALGAMGLASVARRWEPAVLVAFDEIGTWARLVPAVGRRYGIPTVDLPHAEAATADAIIGADYDRIAVFGPRAAEVLTDAAVPSERIVEIGAPGFDEVVRAGPSSANADDPRPHIVLAAQYPTGNMTRDGQRAVFSAAAAAAGAVKPSRLSVVPHPAEPVGLAAELAAELVPEDGVDLAMAAGGLHEALDDAWLLVTGWSNSVFEAAIRRVPSLLVDLTGVAPINYAADGLGLPVSDIAAAAGASLSMRDAARREALVERARGALADHLGSLDGKSSERAAALIMEAARHARTRQAPG